MHRFTFFIVALSLALSACGAERSRSRPSEITYRPDDTNLPRTVWTFAYDDDGFLEDITREVDGDRDRRDSFKYEGGKLIEVVRSVFDPDYEIVVTYAWDGDKVSGTIATASVDFENENGDVTSEYDYDQTGTLTYDGSRLIEEVIHTESTTKSGEGLFAYVVKETRESTTTLSYDDANLISSFESNTELDAETIIGDGEPSTARSTTGFQLDFSYNDESLLSAIEGEFESKAGDDDTVRQTAEGELTYSEGVLTRVELESTSNNVTTTNEDEIDYDDEGRISRIEDEDGNRYDIEYDEGEIQGVTIKPPVSVLDNLFDLEGKGFFSDWRQDHRGLP